MKLDSTSNWTADNASIITHAHSGWGHLSIDHVVIALVAINMVGVGGHVDGERLVELLKKPLLVCVAMLLRFALMPALGLGLVELFSMKQEESMSVLSILLAPHECIGCLFIALFEGDLTLAVAIELVNNFSTTAFLPLWAIIYESTIYENLGHIQLPVRNTFLFLAVMCAAASLGFLVRNRHPGCYDACWTWLPGFTIATIVFILATEFYTNKAIFALTSMESISCGLILAVTGFVLPALLSFLLQQSNKKTLVFCVENGLRTTYISRILAISSYPYTHHYANIIPTYTSIFTLWTMLCTMLVFRYMKTRSAFKDVKKYGKDGSELETLNSHQHGEQNDSNTLLDISL